MTTRVRKPDVVAAYLRTATGNPWALALKRSAIQEYVAQQGLTLHGLYEDIGVSGLTPFAERQAGQRLLKDAALGNFGCVLLLDRSCVSDGYHEIAELHERLSEVGVFLCAVNEPFDTRIAAISEFLSSIRESPPLSSMAPQEEWRRDNSN